MICSNYPNDCDAKAAEPERSFRTGEVPCIATHGGHCHEAGAVVFPRLVRCGDIPFDIELFAKGVDRHIEVCRGDQRPQGFQFDESFPQVADKLFCLLFLIHFNDLRQERDGPLPGSMIPGPGV